MNQFKRAQVVMLPTELKSIIFLNKQNKLRFLGKLLFSDEEYSNNHLYIISDDKIKHNDWVYDKETNTVFEIDEELDYKEIKKLNDSLFVKKIIASTNTLLVSNYGSFLSPDIKKVPQPSQQFIEKYIESYNKGEIIVDILVEYEIFDNQCDGFSCQLCNCDNDKSILIENLKINPKDNTITIKKLKNSWNREEHISDIRKFYNEYKFSGINIDKWIEENV